MSRPHYYGNRYVINEFRLNAFYYDSARIHHVNELCNSRGTRLWDDFETVIRGDDNQTVIQRIPPMTSYDIALIQASLGCFMGYNCDPDGDPIVASLAIDWKSDHNKFPIHIVRFDLTSEDLYLPLVEDERKVKWCAKAEELRAQIDPCFSGVEAMCVAHHMGWLREAPDDAMIGMAPELMYRSSKISLPNEHGTIIITLVSPTDEPIFADQLILDVGEHFNQRCSPPCK